MLSVQWILGRLYWTTKGVYSAHWKLSMELLEDVQKAD